MSSRDALKKETLNDFVQASAPTLQMHHVSATIECNGLLFRRIGERQEQPGNILGVPGTKMLRPSGRPSGG